MSMNIPDTAENREKYQGFSRGKGGTRFSMNSRKRYAKDQEEKKKREESEERRRSNATAQRNRNSAGVASNKDAIANQPKSQPEQNSKQSAAKQIVQDYQANLANKKTPWQEAQETVNSSANFAGFKPASDDTSQTGNDQVKQMKETGQDFADKYKLDLIKNGATN